MASAPSIQGIHHISAISGSPEVNYEFYTQVLGLRFVKKTVNFDDPFTYHLYYGNQHGAPGSAITFFPWTHVVQGSPQTGETTATSYAIPFGGLEGWLEHLSRHHVSYDGPFEQFGQQVLALQDPDGQQLHLVEDAGVSGVEHPHVDVLDDSSAIRGFFGATLDVAEIGPTAQLLEAFGWSFEADESGLHRYRAPGDDGVGKVIDLVQNTHGEGRFGKGTIHHIAFRVPNEEAQAAWVDQLTHMGFSPTPVQERFYFKAIYFREKNGVLFEIATDEPGFTADESIEELGSSLKLPAWYEPHREKIEQALPDLQGSVARS
ncbi:MAG: ring-cleaving dioxygenase [Balneolaceae bacterium]|nr:ring-cleaving dioxygenase [Balneolaceae bacterium]